jgi:uncharacterized circularly permuted ATP-grasp superfamily protein/uncharacterized alpha-E superfamily protein
LAQTSARYDDAVSRLLADYRTAPGTPDELIDADGAVRPAWRQFVEHFASLSRQEIETRFALGDQYLRDAGVFYRQSDGPSSKVRQWPLSHIPVFIAESEWRAIEAGLVQRAELLEEVVQDIYGDNNLVAEGLIPPELIAQNPRWARPLVGAPPRSGHYLHFLAFELGRSPDGRWWVLNDRTDAPAGAGFALENRVATSRIYSDLYARQHILRIAVFFRAFRESLLKLRPHGKGHAAILTPGTHTPTYYEHAYIARYLGLMLVEGEDIVVDKGRPKVRTVAGAQPISVLWRRMDAEFSDPLELRENSLIGLPGLVGAVRRQTLSLVNEIGSEILETRAFLAFLPRLCEKLRGEPLALPNIATWWCGQTAERDHVRANIKSMMISSAFSTRMKFDPVDAAVLGGQLRDTAFDSVQALLEYEGASLVAQQDVALSTSPAFVDGKLVPRPVSIRVFMARTENGWIAMPGGYARIGHGEDTSALAPGGMIADVWVVADEAPAKIDTMMPSTAAGDGRATQRDLPSRAAENLFWLGRYVERAEALIRLHRAYDVRVAETNSDDLPIVEYLAGYLRFLGGTPEGLDSGPLTDAIASATTAAGRIRDRLSPDAWAAIAELDRAALTQTPARPGAGAVAQRTAMLRLITGFAGLIHENMYRNLGWRFLSLGRNIERAMATASMLASLTDPKAPEGALEAALECADSALSYRRAYSFLISPETVLEFVGFDADNPRSLSALLNDTLVHVKALPDADVRGALSAPHALTLRLHTDFAVRKPESVTPADLLQLRQDLGALSDLIVATYMQ